MAGVLFVVSQNTAALQGRQPDGIAPVWLLGRIRILVAFLRRNLGEQILVGSVNRIRLVVYLTVLSVADGMDTASSGKLGRVMKTRRETDSRSAGVALQPGPSGCETVTPTAGTLRSVLTSVSTCFGHHYAHLQENKGPVTAFGVLFWFCWMCLVAVAGRCDVGCEQCSHPTSSARILQRSAPQPLPTTSSRTRAVHHMQ